MYINVMTAMDTGEPKPEGFSAGDGFGKTDIFGAGQQFLEEPTPSAFCHRYASVVLRGTLSVLLLPMASLLVKPNNRFSGIFSWINPYSRQFFLIKCCHRVLSGIFSVIITSESILLGVYQEFLTRPRPDAWSIVLSAVRV
jgi:hypothetical protein